MHIITYLYMLLVTGVTQTNLNFFTVYVSYFGHVVLWLKLVTFFHCT